MVRNLARIDLAGRTQDRQRTEEGGLIKKNESSLKVGHSTKFCVLSTLIPNHPVGTVLTFPFYTE